MGARQRVAVAERADQLAEVRVRPREPPEAVERLARVVPREAPPAGGSSGSSIVEGQDRHLAALSAFGWQRRSAAPRLC